MLTADIGRYNFCDKNLGLLLELIHKDADSYREEFMEQFQHYQQTMKLLHLQPMQHKADLVPFLELINFLAHGASYYSDETKEFASNIMSVLRSHSAGLNPEVRMAFCKALVVLRNKKLAAPVELLELFFELVKCPDKQLRRFVYGSVVSHLRRLKNGKSNQKLIGRLQSFLFSKLKDSRSIVARVAELVLIDAFRKNILKDAKTANAVSECCFHKLSRLQVVALRFFLGSVKDEEGFEDDSESDVEVGSKEDQKTLKEVVTAFRAAKKTRKKIKDFEKAKKLISKEKKLKKEERSKFCNLFAIQSLYDPQTFSDRLLGMLTSNKNEKFDLRLLRIALCARIIGIHKLQSLSFYTYLHRYLQPKQREVTRILLYGAQACHELVPPDIVEQLVRVIAQNFVTDCNSPEAITVGLNAIREIFTNCPFAATEELLRDLTEYKRYKNKNVSMAARGLITLFRAVNPKLLHKKDRGRPTEAIKELDVLEFGKQQIKSFVPGAECLPTEAGGGPEEESDEESSSDGSWVDLSDSGDENSDQSIIEATEKKENDEVTKGGPSGLGGSWEIEKDTDEEEDVVKAGDNSSDDKDEGCNQNIKKSNANNNGSLTLVNRAEVVSESRILTQEEFRKIHAFQLKKQVTTSKRLLGNQKRKLDDIKLDEELEEKFARLNEGDGLPRLKDIERFHKKIHRQTKEERKNQAEEGRTDKEMYKKPKKRGPHVGRTNRELAKRKNFQMVRQKVRGRNRQRSFRDQQNSLRKYLLRQAGRKV